MTIQYFYQHLKKHQIRHFLFDSRQLLHPKETVFIAIKGKRNDGHLYIQDLYKKGVRHFLIEEKIDKKKYPNAHFLPCKNTIETFQQLVSYHRQLFNIPVIGITGSNGKTIVKEWLFLLLQDRKNIVRSPQSYNSQIGVPLSVWQMDESHELGIFEAGISQVGEMAKIAPIIQCSWGIFTSLGSAHDAGFSSRKEKALEKSKLFYKAEKVFYNKDIKEIQDAITNIPTQSVTWSYTQTADLHIQTIHTRKDGVTGAEIIADFRGEKLSIHIPFSDEVSCHNAIICWLVLLEMGMPNEAINQRMQALKPIAMRLEMKQGVQQCRLINDTYNLDITSLKSSLRFMDEQAGEKSQTLIISDVLQHQENTAELYHILAEKINQHPVNKVIGVGECIPLIQEKLQPHIATYFYKNTSDFLSHIDTIPFYNEMILVKGAREFRFEKIIKRLEQKVHRTVLEINFNALENNLNVFKNLVQKPTRIMVMVKAAAYGSGLVEVAQFIENQGVDYFAVAYMDEGIELRKAGITIPILVLNAEVDSFDALLRHELEPEIYNLSQLHQFQQAALRHHITRPNIHIKLDTGMKRLGFTEEDLADLIAIIRDGFFNIQSVFSHLAGSDSEEHDEFTRLQIQRYETMYNQISAAIQERPMRHIVNSSGITRFPEQHWDMVRLGIGLYGLNPVPHIQHQLQTIGTLKATISQIKSLKTGETIGYGRHGKATRLTRTATVSIGYADGFPRAAGYGKYRFMVRGKLAATIGVICMDMCMIDVTDIPDAQAGDEVIIFGENPSIRDLATCLNTIPYEVLTAVSERVKRVYVRE